MSYYLDSTELWLSPLRTADAPSTETVADWARAFLGFHPDPVQAEILNAYTPRLAVCCTRQWGKTSVAAVKALHLAWTKPGALILFASPTYEQSMELLRRCAAFAAALLGHPCRAETGRKGSILLPNGSRIYALAQSPASVRGYSAPDLIVIDEAAFVAKQMHDALSPMLAVSDGQLWLLSCPRGQSGDFYDAWHSTGPRWRRFTVTAEQCPRISPAFLASERVAKDDRVFRQEYMCEFLPSEKEALDRKWIEEAFRGDYPAMQFEP